MGNRQSTPEPKHEVSSFVVIETNQTPLGVQIDSSSSEDTKAQERERIHEQAIKDGKIKLFSDPKMGEVFGNLMFIQNHLNSENKARTFSSIPWLEMNSSPFFCPHCAWFVCEPTKFQDMIQKETNEELCANMSMLDFYRRVWFCFTIYYVTGHLNSEKLATILIIGFYSHVDRYLGMKEFLVVDSPAYLYGKALKTWVADVTSNLPVLQSKWVEKHL